MGLALLLSGCATLPESAGLPPLSDWEQRQQVLAAIDDWAFAGRIAVRDAEDGFNGKLNWEQRRDYFDVRLSGPLGAGSVIIAGDVDHLTVTDKDGETLELADPERDLRLRYGWRIPVRSLRYWVLGSPDPNLPADTALDDDGRLATLTQGGWTVTISAYRAHGDEMLPRRLTASQDAARVRLVVDRWTFY